MRNHLTDVQTISILPRHASVAELVDAADSKSAVGNNVGVRFSPEAPIYLALKSSDLGAFLFAHDNFFAALPRTALTIVKSSLLVAINERYF